LIIFCLISCGPALLQKGKLNSVDIQKSPLLGQKMQTIEAKFGPAKYVKAISAYGGSRKVFSRGDWDKFGWEIYDAGHYLYRFKRNNNEVQYNVLYVLDASESKLHPTERVSRTWIFFDRPPTLNELSELIPEIKPFDNQNIRVFIENRKYSDETKLLYLANPSDLAGLIAGGYKKDNEGWGFSAEIILKDKIFNPNELSKVEEVQMDVFGIRYLRTHDDKPYKFIKLSK
jgi:hypothetical protein